jgi:rare lipoprotein A
MRPQMDLHTSRARAAIVALGLSYAASTGTSLGAHAASASTGDPSDFTAESSVRTAPNAALLLTPAGQSIAPEMQAEGPTEGPMFTAPSHTALRVRQPNLNVLDGHTRTISGTLSVTLGSGVHERRSTALAGRVVALQVLNVRHWSTVAHTRTGANGRYRLRYMPRQAVSEQARVRFAGDTQDLGAHRALGRLNVYRLAEASWYGGGGSLACGGALTSATMGVANKTLPCGTSITLRYDRRSVRVRVIDRGPYVAGREFDLTEATKRALGFGDTGEVWSTR